MTPLDYRAILARDGDMLLVTCPDLPEVTTFGEDEADALLRAVDAIEEALAARIAHREEIPVPTAVRGHPVTLPLLTRMKVELYKAAREDGVRKAELARRLHAHAPQVDRLLDIRHTSQVSQIEAAFHALGRTVAFEVHKET
ncbi:MAG: type II toxin-antitoxin system HicB family antitoxin [Alphaproteobacteria bacterium]|nr:type II toxin-antitoxin system HicB family antitoxin [Alphaproteobacteria bacterium]